MGTVLQDHSLMKKLRTHARRTVLEHFCLEEVTAIHMKTIISSYRLWSSLAVT